MSSAVHELDPDGDVMLILRNPNAPFAAWEENVEALPAPVSPAPAFPTRPLTISDDHLLTWASFSTGKKKKKKMNKKKGGIPSFKSLDPGPAPPSQEPAPEEPAPDEAAPDEAALEDTPAPNATAPDNDPSNPEEFSAEVEVEVRMRLSSKHLTLASTYFKKMLQGSWQESIASPDSYHTIFASEWDTEAMLILMNIIHGRVRSVPRSISLEMLAKLAVLVDYYDCHEVVTLFADVWVRNLEAIPNEYCRDLILWLVVSWVFCQGTHFELATKLALQKSDEPLQTLNLPIPSRIVETIDQQRQELVEQIISGLHNLVSYFHQRVNCSFACSSILLGALTKQMQSNGLLSPKPTKPFPGYSTAGTTTIVRGFISPIWVGDENFCSRHMCTLDAFIDPTICSFVDGINGLKLEDFQA